jgi:hypothetical protein
VYYCSRHRHEQAAKEREDAQQVIHHSLLKKLNLDLQIYIMLNSLSGCKIFLFDAI